MAGNILAIQPSLQYTLSERYQLTENIRIFRALKRICITIAFFNAIVMSVGEIANYISITQPFSDSSSGYTDSAEPH
jgi:hypothetical protein